ncbi:hypothetical protein DNH61_25450 [Paenibacillus sambharensis]|uniref:Uncharacterized protein n=1 Tax=Paenibacillus sambharensis TaxID=1803190 RepID=A0A2W1L448_9BACL|nr:hypothetical protein [Paenibacillus sambharensis]PZD92950.1 hypothetical protein DNH61_25450 [Paenibacillus sambharensis]
MKAYRSLLHKDIRQSRFAFLLSFSMLMFLQLGCFVLAHGVEPGLATVLSIFGTYLSAFLMPVLFLQSLQAEWKSHTVYYWMNSPGSGYPVLLAKLTAAAAMTVLIMGACSAATLGIYTYEAHVIDGLSGISQSMKPLLAQAYRMDAVLLLYAVMFSLGLGFVFLAGKSVRYGSLPAFAALCAVLAVSIGSMLGGWLEWLPFRLPLGISLANESLAVEYATYSLGGIILLLILSAALLLVNNWLLKEKAQVTN